MSEPPVSTDSLLYLRIVLESYVRWRRGGVELGVACFANVVGMDRAVEHRRLVDLSDDDFTIVDRAFASLLTRDREVLEVEYTMECHPKDKAAELGYGALDNVSAAIGQYKRDLRQAESRIYLALQPHVDDWEMMKPVRRRR